MAGSRGHLSGSAVKLLLILLLVFGNTFVLGSMS